MHILYKSSKAKYIQTTNFYPIKSLYKKYDINALFVDIGCDLIDTKQFSLIKTEKYSKRCSSHYYLPKNKCCPITDIKLETQKNNDYKDYIQITNKEYIYYIEDSNDLEENKKNF